VRERKKNKKYICSHGTGSKPQIHSERKKEKRMKERKRKTKKYICSHGTGSKLQIHREIKK